MVRKKTKVNIDEVMKNSNERFEETKKIENKIRSSNEYIMWLKDFLEKHKYFIDFDIVYEKENMEEEEYKNICNLYILHSIIQEYYQRNYIFPTFLDTDGTLLYRVYYEDFCFEIGRVEYRGGHIEVRKVETMQDAINYKDIMEDKEPKEYKEKDEFIKEFRNKIKYYGKKAKKLDIDVKYLKKIIEEEFKS